MTALYRNLSIRAKLAAIALLTCVTALTLALAALFAHEVRSFKRALERDLRAQTNMLAGLSPAALAFDDAATAGDLLGELRSQSHIRWAVIFKDGKPFARYRHAAFNGREPDAPPAEFGSVFRGGELSLHTPIVQKGERVGTIVVGADTAELGTRLREYALILLAVFALAAAAALAMAWRLQRAIFRPVQQLAEAARVVADRQDYSVRVEQRSVDELGRLTAAFNQMLERIEAQDTALREERERFEIAVAGARDGVWDWNLLTGERYHSARWMGMLGFAPADAPAVAKTWEDLLHPEDRPRRAETMRRYLAGELPTYEIEFRMRHKDGGYRWILSRGAALRDAAGRPFRMAGSHTDITERKEAAEQIARMQRELVDASRRAGMAEVATGVLHNVGNVLNSVNISASLILDRLRASRTESLARAVALMRSHEAELGTFLSTDPKGRQLPRFLEAVAQELGGERDALAAEAQSLRKNVEHIKHIVGMQQSFARVGGALERITLADLADDALRIQGGALARHDVAVEREFADVPPFPADRHRILQILVNLIANAREAVEARESGRRIAVRIVRRGTTGVAVEVADNGTGIAPENVTRIFSHGFTTKKDGHGFGLHSCANAAREMGGSLCVRSDGPGCGATFTLELPLQAEDEKPRLAA